MHLRHLYEFLLVLASLEVVVDVLSTDLVAVVLYLQPRQGLVGLWTISEFLNGPNVLLELVLEQLVLPTQYGVPTLKLLNLFLFSLSNVFKLYFEVPSCVVFTLSII